MRTIENAPLQQHSKGRRVAGAIGHGLLHPSHTIAEGVGNIVQPFVNASQYRTFHHPERNRKKINREMFRTFQTAGRTIEQDTKTAIGLAAMLVLGAALGEHVPIPLAQLGLPAGIPVPFHIDLQFPIPITEALNNIPFIHLPTEVNYHENYWPLFTSNFVTSGINITNAVRAHKEKRPVKRVLYAFSALACFTHIPLVFNSIWYEVATAGPQRISRRTFAKNAELVLSGKADIPDKKPWYQHIGEALRGEIEVNPKERNVFVDAVNNQFTPDRPKKYWEALLSKHKTITSEAYTHHLEEEKEASTKQKGISVPKRITRWIHKKWHHFLSERDEHKLEAIESAQKFIEYTEEKS